jgi:hypothetical protein
MEDIMGTFLGIVVVIVVVVVVVKMKSKEKAKEKAIEDFYGSAAYQVGEQIKNELVSNGYSGGNDWTPEYKGSYYGTTGSIYLKKTDGDNVSDDGFLKICLNNQSGDTVAHMYHNQKNGYAQKGQYYVIANDFLGLFVCSEKESKEIPPFIEIAARVIKNSDYKFEHPDWWFERYPDTRKYLNVMFQ